MMLVDLMVFEKVDHLVFYLVDLLDEPMAVWKGEWKVWRLVMLMVDYLVAT